MARYLIIKPLSNNHHELQIQFLRLEIRDNVKRRLMWADHANEN